MAFSRTIIGWIAVTVLFVGWAEVARRLKGTPGPAAAAVKAGLPALAIEALLLTLFAGLWFGSLGSGGAVLLFLVVGALMEIPYRLRSEGHVAWKPALAGVVRVIIAGELLGLLLG